MNTCVTSRLRRGVLHATAVVAALTIPALASDEVNTDRTGLAIGGYDTVAYFSSGRPVKGNFQITAEHEGVVYRFANEKNRDVFESNPERYAPQYGGYCAYGVAENAKFSADPTVWKIVDNRLYLNLDKNIARLFNRDLSGHIAKANDNWRSLENKPAR